METIKGRTVIVTGASRGIGRAIALALAQEGANLFLVGRSSEHLLALQREPELTGAMFFEQDLRADGAAKRVIQACVQAWGGVDVLINNAGHGEAYSLEDTDERIFDEMFSLNVRAPFFLMRSALPYLERSECAGIVNISSVVGIKGYELQSAYTASKHALDGMSKSLARELFERGIRVQVVHPGGVETDMIRGCRPDLDVETLSKPEEIADIVVFLLKFRDRSAIDEITVRRHTKAPFD